jgi:signal transduction histidine kinase
MRSFLGVPVTVSRGSTGNLYLTNKLDAAEFSEDDQRLVEMFALHAGIAIETARLHAEVQQLAVIGERDRIAKDLHDGIIQASYAVVLSLDDVPDLMRTDAAEASDRIERAIERLNLAIRNIRNFIMGLGPEGPGAPGLVAGLSALTDEIRLNTLINVELDVTDAGDGHAHVDDALAFDLLQMTREALSNAVRHSRARNIRISLRQQPDRLRLEIGDDGRGFDLEQAQASGHFGLANLRERAGSHGGSARIETRAGAGTRILITVPSRAPERSSSAIETPQR